ncbi:hypothetical protein [Anaerobacillus sp. CMMVII]|nr:hypothetical protein [Anaerobacillus sp. CMMVII]
MEGIHKEMNLLKGADEGDLPKLIINNEKFDLPYDILKLLK